MSPASYRAAPPRVGSHYLTGAVASVQIAYFFVGDGLGVEVVALPFGVGVTVTLPPLGAAATARWIASSSCFCAAPYAAKSPSRSAFCPAAYAAWMSASALV